MKRRRKNRTPLRPQAVALLAVMLFAPFLLYQLAESAWFGRLGESAAMLAAAIQLPDGTAVLLEERFRAEIYNPEGGHASSESEQGEPLPAQPAEPAPKEGEGPSAPMDSGPSETGPRIPAQYAAPIISEDFSARGNTLLLEYGAGLIRNETKWDDVEIEAILEEPYGIRFEATADPQVLIVHTHATEAFEKYDSPQYDTRNTWRSTDNRNNMVAVGDTFAQVLEDNGIGVIHDTTQHDHPSYNGSYERSAVTISDYLRQYPSIKVVLDLHRDAMQRDDAIVKPVAVIDGKKAAQIMIISACDDGTMDVPEWRQNLRFAAAYQDYMEQYYPGLTRPIYFCYRKYNMDLTTGSLLLEFGSNANTLDEAVYSAGMSAEALVQLIRENRQLSEEESAKAAAEALSAIDPVEEEPTAGEEPPLMQVVSGDEFAAETEERELAEE